MIFDFLVRDFVCTVYNNCAFLSIQDDKNKIEFFKVHLLHIIHFFEHEKLLQNYLDICLLNEKITLNLNHIFMNIPKFEQLLIQN